jgi:hypothetical protein
MKTKKYISTRLHYDKKEEEKDENLPKNSQTFENH